MTTPEGLLRTKHSVTELNSVLILRLISELEGSCFFLECIDKEDFETVSSLRSKYYKMYFRLSKKEKERSDENLSGHE